MHKGEDFAVSSSQCPATTVLNQHRIVAILTICISCESYRMRLTRPKSFCGGIRGIEGISVWVRRLKPPTGDRLRSAYFLKSLIAMSLSFQLEGVFSTFLFRHDRAS